MPHTLDDQDSASLASFVVGIHEQPKEIVDDEGVKKTRVVFLVEIRSTVSASDGPWDSGTGGGIFDLETPTASLAACAVGIPKTGEPLNLAFTSGSLPPSYVGDGGDEWFVCQPGYSAKPYKTEKGERAKFWLVTREYTASLEGLHVRNPKMLNATNDSSKLNIHASLEHNAVFTGGISKTSRPFRNSYAACPIKDFMSNANESSELMRQVSYMTVTVSKVFSAVYYGPQLADGTLQVPASSGGSVSIPLNSLHNTYFGIENLRDVGEIAKILSYALNKVNVFPMWGYPPRHVRFDDVSWSKVYDAKGEEYLKADMTFKIAPPWLTTIPANNPTSKYRSSYGFDEPQIILSNRFLNKELFKRPSNSPKPSNRVDTPRTPTSSGTYDSASEQMVKGDRAYRRPTPGLFKIPPARTFLTGPRFLSNPSEFTGIGFPEYDDGGVYGFPNVLVPSVGWQDWASALQSAALLEKAWKANRVVGAQSSPFPTAIEVLNMWSWYVWNPMNYYDTPNLVFDYTNKPGLSDDMAIPSTERYNFCQEVQFYNDEVTIWARDDRPPNVYSAEGADQQTWVDFIPGMGEEAVKRVNEKGHPIWVNTIATSYNFDKWPGFPYVPGQDMSEMLVYPAIDSGFDFRVFGLPTP